MFRLYRKWDLWVARQGLLLLSFHVKRSLDLNLNPRLLTLLRLIPDLFS